MHNVNTNYTSTCLFILSLSFHRAFSREFFFRLFFFCFLLFIPDISFILRKIKTQMFHIVLFAGVFLICWVPFFSCNIMDAMCTIFGLQCSPGVTAFILTTWLGYMNSFVNPIIYTIFNPEFRKAFKKIMNIK